MRPVKLTRVTTILDYIESQWKEFWYRSVGFKKADKISKKSSAFGTKVHKKIEQILKNEIRVDLDSLDPSDQCAIAVIMYLEEHGFKPLLETYENSMEIEVSDEDLGLVGHFDYAAVKDDVPYIVDFKTSKKMRNSFPVQKAAYAYMLNKQKKLKIEHGITLRSHWNEETKEVEFEVKEYNNLIKKYWPIFHKCLDIYRYFTRVDR